MQRSQSIFAFTLVELIVVITIVGILSTVGFVSYSGYLTGARDSNRISQMVKLSDSLQVYGATKTLPLPDNAIEIKASGKIVAYQGEIGVDVLETIDYTNGGKDPKDDNYYTYYLTKDRRALQLLALMEDEQSIALGKTKSVQAISFEERYPKVYGRKLGILTYADTSNSQLFNTPAHQIIENITAGEFDLVTSDTSYISHISDDINDKIEGTGSVLASANPSANCQRIKHSSGTNNSGFYNVNPDGLGVKKVYCNMEVSGGGWTLLGRSHPSPSTLEGFSWLLQRGEVDNYNDAYSMGSDSKVFLSDQILLLPASSGEPSTDYVIVVVDNAPLQNETSDAVLTKKCTDTQQSCTSGIGGFDYWGRMNTTTNYYFTEDGADNNQGLRANGFPGDNIVQGELYVR